MKRLLIFCFLYASGLALPTEPLFDSQPLVRVRVVNSLDTLNISTHANWVLDQDDLSADIKLNHRKIQVFKRSDRLIISDSNGVLVDSTESFFLESRQPGGTLTISQVPFGVGWWWGGREDRIYEGRLHIYLDSAGDLCVTIHLPLETYLKGVVPYEIGGDSPLEALKAQAVAARSEAVIALTSKLYSGEHHDLTSDVECQVFSGNHKRTALADQAVDETMALVISEDGKPINAYYASNCGGHAELIENVWPTRPRPKSYQVAYPDKPKQTSLKLNRNWRFWWWLRSSPEVNCNPTFEPSLPSWSQKNFRWTRSFTHADISEMFSTGEDLGAFKKLDVIKRGVSGRIIKARLIFENGDRLVEGELALRQCFSPSLRSSAFIIKKNRKGFVLKGAGWGHGVGMCQSGAVAQADKGASFKEILRAYYPDAELLRVY
jgi:stage II sporulation protein D